MLVRTSGFSVFGGLLIGLIGLAWVALFVGGQSPYGRFLDHKNLDLVRVEGGPALLLFLGGWLLMIVAMMLSTSLPLVVLFHRIVRQRVDRGTLITLLLLGFLRVWTCLGFLVEASDSLV